MLFSIMIKILLYLVTLLLQQLQFVKTARTTLKCASLNDCNGHGLCHNNKCQCFEGWGGATYDSTSLVTAIDCSLRTCPHSTSWADLPDRTGFAHRNAECSSVGVCDRSTGICKCDNNYEGPACERMRCPNMCSGHGRCLSMRKLASYSNAFPLNNNTRYRPTEAQLFQNQTSITWDADKIFGCLCDSSWSVGLGSNETQEAEWFGADCSLRHCPSGDDPRTTVDETNCYNKTAKNSNSTGERGNKCQVDCSNQGVCDYNTGICKCFKGYYGVDCSISSALQNSFSTSTSTSAAVNMDGSTSESESSDGGYEESMFV